MSRRLLIRLDAHGDAAWLALGRDGTPLHGERAGLPEAAADVTETIVLVPAEDVLVLPMPDLPGSPRQRQQALPFAIEEQLAAPVEQQHVVLSADPQAVLVVARTRMQGWLSRLHGAGRAAPAVSSVRPSPASGFGRCSVQGSIRGSTAIRTARLPGAIKPGGRQHPLVDAEALAATAREQLGVTGASPYIEAEVMVSSPTNLSGVILRGIDPDHIGHVSTLVKDMREGKLEYLRDPAPLQQEIREKRTMEMDLLLERLDRERKELGRLTGDGDAGAGGRASGDLGAPAVPSHLEQATRIPGIDAEPVPEFDEPEEGAMPLLPHQVQELEEEGGGDEPGMPPLPGLDDGANAEPQLPGLVIGPELAKSLQVELGDEVNVVTPNGGMGPMGPIPRSRPFEIVGIFYSGMYEYDANFAYTAIEDASDFLGVEGATGIELKTTSVDAAESIALALQQTLGPKIEVLDWKELNRSLFYALKLEKIAMFVVLTFIILVASFSIVAMLIMIVIEKGREIAILKSMGASNAGVMRTFVFQGLVIGSIGAAIGLVLGLAICYFLATVGFPLNSEVYYINTLPVDVDPVEVVVVVVCAIVISLLATVYPSVQAARLNPVDGLRYE